MEAILTRKLTKWYGRSRGIIDVDLAVEEGEIFGFIGPNGAGKSTTIRTLLALIRKTSGEARIFGLDCERDYPEILSQVGYLPGEVFYYDRMKAIDLLRYSASFYRQDCSARRAELAEALDLDLGRRIEDMSLGNKKKVGIVQGLQHRPRLIILDEPTSGLDPLIQRTFFDLIADENSRGATVLFSSHILSEVQRICDRVAIIKEGSIIQTSKIADLRRDSYKKVSFRLRPDVSLAEPFVLEGATAVESHDGATSFLYRGDINDLLRGIASAPLADVQISDPSLDEIFLHYYSG